MVSNRIRILKAVLLLAAGVAGIANSEERAELRFEQLMAYDPVEPRMVDNRFFVSVDGAAQAAHQFSGVVRIPGHTMSTEPTEIKPEILAGKKTQQFPEIELGFSSYNGYLVPVDRSIVVNPSSDSFWQLQASPGRVWSEDDDNGMSRASFPFFLTSIVENETYNGIATFLYDDDSVSQLRYQIVQQLTPFMIETWFVAVGQQDIEYRPARFDSKQLFEDFDQELRNRLTWRNWSELEDEFGSDTFANFDSGIDPHLIVASGLIIDSEVYVRSMSTPYGDYPYPREMRHGVWSATKSLAGLVTLLRMAQKYGDEILNYKIKDYLDITADHDGWDNVTFRHAMSMATGVGTGSETLEPNEIEDGYVYSDFNEYRDWYFAPTLGEKLDHLFRVPNHPWGPGEVVRYRDRDTFVLAAALDSLYKKKEGDAADLWQMMIDEVYGPLDIHHMPMNSTIESGRTNVPLLAYGIYVTIDDIAKISGLMQNEGVHNGTQILSKTALAEALYETNVRGLPTGAKNDYGSKSYHLSLWHEPFVSASGKQYSAPQMVGWGGNIVQLMPNGIVGFRIGNGGYPDVEQMMIIADKIRPFDAYKRQH